LIQSRFQEDVTMAKAVDFSKLSPRAQRFFTEKAAAKKAKPKSGKSKGGKGGGS